MLGFNGLKIQILQKSQIFIGYLWISNHSTLWKFQLSLSSDGRQAHPCFLRLQLSFRSVQLYGLCRPEETCRQKVSPLYFIHVLLLFKIVYYPIIASNLHPCFAGHGCFLLVQLWSTTNSLMVAWRKGKVFSFIYSDTPKKKMSWIASRNLQWIDQSFWLSNNLILYLCFFAYTFLVCILAGIMTCINYFSCQMDFLMGLT